MVDSAQQPIETAATRIAIIGAGIAGLTAAYDLARDTSNPAGTEVVVLEAGSTLGGLAAGFKGRPEWDWPLEHFYHHLFTNDYDIIKLTEEIGMADQLVTYSPVTAMFMDGELYPLDSALRVMRFPHIPVIDRLRMGMVIAYLRYHPAKPWRRFDKMVADEWLNRTMGRKAYNTVWKPMLQGKFGDDYDKVNLAWFWARFYKRTKNLAYFNGGFQAFVDGLARAATDAGATILTDRRITRVNCAADGKFVIEEVSGSTEKYDLVLVTVSPSLMTRLVPELPAGYTEQLTSLKSIGAVVLTVALDRKLMDEVYWANIPTQANMPFLALVEHTNMIAPSHYDGDHLLYIGDYLSEDHPYFELNAAELLSEFLPHLPAFNRSFNESWVKGVWIHKAKYAQPVPPVGYAEMIPEIRTPLDGLYFASMSQVYPWDRGTNYAVEMGRKVARMMTDDLRIAM